MSFQSFFRQAKILRFYSKASFGLLVPMLTAALLAAGGTRNRLEYSGQPQPGSAAGSYAGDEACQPCHASIYRSYKRTPMAHASGAATDNLIPADFTHAPSGVHYRIYKESGRAWLSFDRDSANPLHGKRELLYYIGSGRRGLTYLFGDDGFVFESPINWYGDKQVWDMTPAYQDDTEAPLNLPVHTRCLHCHISGMRPPMDGTENRYAMPLLSHSGVSCERCHGPGAAHVKGAPALNPAKLSSERRDAICMQCHMEGRVSIERPGKHVYEFRPGDSLSDYVRYYVLSDSTSALGAVSQVEALAESVCKKKSGEAMSCTSCHDPHYVPSSEERVAYFRKKCLACHGTALGAKHHPKQSDCTACHMPALASANIAHTQVTDHRIPRLVGISSHGQQDTNPSREMRLAPFPDSREAEDDLRDLALAWETLANTGVESARARAQQLLRRSAAAYPNDAPTLAALGYEEQSRGNMGEAQDLYRRALAVDPNLTEAAANLGVLEAESGDYPSAIEELRRAFERSPGRSAAGMDLARVLCLAGKIEDARESTLRVLKFNPDRNSAQRFLRTLSAQHPNCNAN